MKYRKISRVVRNPTPKTLSLLLNWPDQNVQVLDVLRQLPLTEEFFGPERRIERTVSIPESWTEQRESLRPFGIGLVWYGKCRWCEGRYEATSPRKKYCSDKCQRNDAAKRCYPIRQSRGDFKMGMAKKREKKSREAVEQRRLEEEETMKAMCESPYYDKIYGVQPGKKRELIDYMEEWRRTRREKRPRG